MKLFLACFTVALLFVCPFDSAYAGWAWTNWNMRSAEFLRNANRHGIEITKTASYKGAPIPTVAVSASVDFLHRNLKAWFTFEQDRLSNVRLSQPNAADCPKIESELLRLYGRPAEVETVRGSDGKLWLDQAHQNKVWFNSLGPSRAGVKWCLIDLSAP